MNKTHATVELALDSILTNNMLIESAGFGQCGVPDRLIEVIVASGVKAISSNSVFSLT